MASVDEKIQQFCELTQASSDQAKFYLESHNWDVEVMPMPFP
jgi:hypothetical protein